MGAGLSEFNRCSEPPLDLNAASPAPERLVSPQDSPSSIFSPGRKGRRNNGSDEEGCCLCWTVPAGEQVSGATEKQLLELHAEVGGMLASFNARMIEDSATAGLILGPRERGAVDVVVHMGQLLCRWATSQSPAMTLRIGVHVGALQALPLRNSRGRQSYFGPACAGARALAEASAKDNTVFISKEVKSSLTSLSLRRVTLDVTGSCFYIDPLADTRATDSSLPHLKKGSDIAINLQSGEEEIERAKSMPPAEFRTLLERHSVDTSKFGKGDAKTLEEFYDAVVREEKSFLVVEGDQLMRVVELLRISLRMIGPDGRLQELRIRSERNAEGGERLRNQPLAIVLHKSDRGRWRQAVSRCFELKFGLGKAQQAKLFDVEAGVYSFEAENSSSQTIPGIMTTYKRHSIQLNVKHQATVEGMGLPGGLDFSTGAGATKQTWTWARLVDNREAELTAVLQKGGVDVSEFTWQAFADLYEEVYDKGMSSFEEGKDGELMRTIRIVKVWLHAAILNVDHVLVLTSKRSVGEVSLETEGGRALTMRMSVDQTWDQSVADMLMSRLGITPQQQQEALAIDQASHRTTEDIAFSRSYPGLKTLYIINEVNVSVLEPQDRRWRFMGLPGGTDFTFTRQHAGKAGEGSTIVTHWSWEPAEEKESVQRTNSVKGRDLDDRLDPLFGRGKRLIGESRTSHAKVTPPQALKVREADELLLGKLMLGRRTDWTLARRAAGSIMDPEYTSRLFYEDICLAFPELRLYCVSRVDIERSTGASVGSGSCAGSGELTPSSRGVSKNETTSGSRMSADDEYQRTIGSLLAVFWLMRLHIDGKECFCFGLDNNWMPKSSPQQHEDEATFKKRQAFYELTDWAAIQRLLVGAGLLTTQEGPHDPKRTLALLVLMSMHDIMKLDILLPTVGRHLGSWRGYKGGETILDHDTALTYVIEHCPQALPSYAGLSPRQQGSIRFTHCQLEYNMGWLVQGEAPPGILFRSFRQVIIADKATESDIALYFVHWFADLAGAEPRPLNGCEKVVAKFPRKVLSSLIDSFSVVWKLGPSKTETQVYEDYLLWRWANHDPDLGPAPTGPGALAKMRLVLMFQGDSQEVLRTLAALPSEERQVLENELAITGCSDQEFRSERVAAPGHGPAILLYYAPALLQKAGRRDLRGALVVLAEVFGQARQLWPLSSTEEHANRTVTVRIDALKDLEVPELLYPEPGFGFVLMRSSAQDGLVKLLPLVMYKSLDWTMHQTLELGEVKSRQRQRSTRNVTRMPTGGRISERQSLHRGISKGSRQSVSRSTSVK